MFKNIFGVRKQKEIRENLTIEFKEKVTTLLLPTEFSGLTLEDKLVLTSVDEDLVLVKASDDMPEEILKHAHKYNKGNHSVNSASFAKKIVETFNITTPIISIVLPVEIKEIEGYTILVINNPFQNNEDAEAEIEKEIKKEIEKEETIEETEHDTESYVEENTDY